jgi:hypothetical protein
VKNIFIIPFFFLLSVIPLTGQSLEFGITYIPVGFSKITFDRDYIIFDDYSSAKLEQTFNMLVPSLSNSGLFVRIPFKSFSIQSGLNFQKNTYYYSTNTYYSNASNSFFYSSIDIPLEIIYTFNPNNVIKFRILAGGNAKLFKIRTNYYSVFKPLIEISYGNIESEAAKKNQEFIRKKINPFIFYSRFGAGFRYFGMTADLCFDKNLTPMNRNIDQYNANFKDTYQINIVLGFTIANKDLKYNRNTNKIIKE